MKKLVLLFAIAIFVSSCEIVIIEPRYDGRDDIVGTWEVDEFSETYNVTTYFDIRISKSYSNFDEIHIHNFYDVNISVLAYLEGNRIVIPFQKIDGYEVEGVGTIRTNRISFVYSVFDAFNGGLTDYCSSTAW